MIISKRALYAAGEPFGDCATRSKMGRGYWCGNGGGSSSQSNPVTNNTDNRSVTSINQTDYSTNITDSRSTSTTDSSTHSYIDNSNSSDAVIALTNAGADIIKNSGGAVVDLAKFQGAQNTDAWNTTLTTGADLIDKMMQSTAQGFALSNKVVDSFTPTDTKNADIGKYAMLAAAAVTAAVLLK